jgi:hypothetical protein
MLVAYLVAALLVAAASASPLPETSEPLETVVSPGTLLPASASKLVHWPQIAETPDNKEAKESVDTVDFALLEYTEKDREKDIDTYLDTAVQADKFGCGSRLICELHRRAESELLPEEVLLRSMFT